MTREEFSLFDVAKIVWKRKKTIITVVSIVTILSLVFSFLLPKWYKATSVIVSERSSSGLNIGAIAGQFGLGGMLSGGDETQSRYIAILNSASIKRDIAKKFNLQEKYNKETMMKTIEEFSSNYSVGLGDEMQISISIIDKDQEIVFDMVNYTVEALDSLNIALSTGSAHNKRIFIEKQIKDIQDTLLNIEHELIKIMKDENVISLEDQVKVGVEKAAELRSSIIMKEVELEVAEKTFQAESPQIIQLKNELESLRGKFNDFYKSSTGKQLFPNFTTIPEVGLEIEILKRKIEYYTTLLKYMGPQYEEAKIEEAKNIPTFQILDKAVRPELKYKPKKSKIVILGFIVSLIFSLYYVYFDERWWKGSKK